MCIQKLFTLGRQLQGVKGWLHIKLKAHISTGTEERKTSERDRNLTSVGVTDFFHMVLRAGGYHVLACD